MIINDHKPHRDKFSNCAQELKLKSTADQDAEKAREVFRNSK